jgi:hypothetical protein
VIFRRINFLLAAIHVQLAASAALADGNKLLSQCQDAEYYLDTKEVRSELSIGRCMGLLQGVRNTMVILDTALELPLRTCWPKDGINNGQAVRIVVRYLKDNPEQLHQDEVFLTLLAYKAAYPCRK